MRYGLRLKKPSSRGDTMSRFIPIELHHASRLLNHGPTVLITSFDEQSQRRNIMAAAWSMPVEFEPHAWQLW
ncbi:hypothetical protein CBL23_18250 [Shigella sonnei]|nr:hypothetical protein CBL23_18250 [Shigella sonnei]